jgi:UDP-N-acetylglucosamine 1-carboxyvinyltransferase
MFVGPLLSRCREVELSLPGGDRIGRRPLDRHIAGLEAMGAEVREAGQVVYVRSQGLKGTRYRFPKNTHTGTETLILAAVMAQGQTILENAAQEPEVDDLIRMLNQMGAKIQRVESRTIVIEGVSELSGTTYRVMSDRNEVVSFACMALATKGAVSIKPVDLGTVGAFLDQLKQIGAGYEVQDQILRVWYDGPLQATDIQTAPHPGIMSDWQPLLVTLLTQAQGTSVVHETVFESRFGYVKDLLRMGAQIELFNPPVANPQDFYNFNWEDERPEYQHAARIHGPTRLHGIETKVPDVRAGATLVLAALTAQGESRISGVEHIERGYEHLDERLQSLGARIEVVRAENSGQ